MYLGAHMLVPEGFDDASRGAFSADRSFTDHFPDDFDGFRTEPPDPNLKPDYSERFHLAGYNRIQQEEAYKFYQQWISPSFPRYLVVEIQHANPYYDDSYAVNSANLGPYGDAIENELIPDIEKQFRGIGQGWARFLYGGSTGGWEALAVQMFYPDHYNGAFAACPDPVDFRAFTDIDLYKDKNAFFIDGRAQARRAARPCAIIWAHAHDDASRSTQYELALGTHGRSGEQFDIWQAVYRPGGQRRLPATDFRQGHRRHRSRGRRVLARALRPEPHPGSAIGPRSGRSSQGKIHIYVGSADTYFLNDAVYYIEDFLEEHEESAVRRRSEIRRPRGALLERRSQPAERLLAPALQHHVPAEDPRSHREDRAAGSGFDVVEVLGDFLWSAVARPKTTGKTCLFYRHTSQW